MDRILHAQPEAMAGLNSQVPAELERVVRKCLEKDRERCYQTMRDLATDLGNVRREGEVGRSARAGAGQRAAPLAAEVTHPLTWQSILRSWWALSLAAAQK